MPAEFIYTTYKLSRQGNVADYEAFRHKELGTAADQPHRIRYKRLAAA